MFGLVQKRANGSQVKDGAGAELGKTKGVPQETPLLN